MALKLLPYPYPTPTLDNPYPKYRKPLPLHFFASQSCLFKFFMRQIQTFSKNMLVGSSEGSHQTLLSRIEIWDGLKKFLRILSLCLISTCHVHIFKTDRAREWPSLQRIWMWWTWSLLTWLQTLSKLSSEISQVNVIAISMNISLILWTKIDLLSPEPLISLAHWLFVL